MTVSKSKRIVTFMLCLFLCVMFIVPPQPVNAVLGTATLVAGGWAVGSEVIGSVIAALIMAATGVSFDNGFFGDTDNLSTMAYEQGYKLVQDMIVTGGNVSVWLDNAIGLYATTKGFTAGDEIEVPAEVLEYTRTWVNENYDFSGSVVLSDTGIINENGEVFLFTDSSNGSYGSAVPLVPTSSVNIADKSIFQIGSIAFSSGYYEHSNDEGRTYFDYSITVGLSSQGSVISSPTNLVYSGSFYTKDEDPSFYPTRKAQVLNSFAFLQYSVADDRIYVGCYDGITQSSALTKFYLKNASNYIVSSESVLTGSDSLSIPQTQDKIIRVPDVPIGSIDGYSVPAIQQLTQDMVISDTVVNPDTPDNPDVVVPDTDAFSVPDTWSGFDAWIKNQAKTITDFTSLIQQKVTGIATDVADFGTSIKEWINEKWGTFTGAFGELKDFVLTIPQILANHLEGILVDVGQLIRKPFEFISQKFAFLNGPLHDFLGIGNAFTSIWHYVVAWVGSLGPWLSTMFMIWNGLPPAMVIPVYATACVVVVVGIYRRFFM